MLTKFQESSATGKRSGQAIAEASSNEAISCLEAFGNLDSLEHPEKKHQPRTPDVPDRSLSQSLPVGGSSACSQTAHCILDNPFSFGQ